MLLGFDIGGTKCAVILGKKNSNDAIEIVQKEVLRTSMPAIEMINSLFITAEAILKKNHLAKGAIAGIGISCGGPLNSKSGVILSPPNLPGWDNISITEMAEKRFGVKAALQNDANACALAEWKYGVGIGHRNLIFLTFGTGMGAGLVLNGSLYPGTTDSAGEAGHIRLATTGPVGFGKAGSFEGFCSGGGIVQLAQTKVREKMQMGEKVSFCHSYDDLPLLNAKLIAEAACDGDEVAIDIYKTSAVFLGEGLAVLIDLLNPEMIIIGGIYTRAQSLIEPSMRKIIEKETLPGAYKACKIVPAALGENIGDIAALTLAAMANDLQA